MGRKILTVLLILLLAFIWGHSCMPAEASQEESIQVWGFLLPLLRFFSGGADVTLRFVRKLAHFAEFFCLGCILSLLLPRPWKGRLLAGNLALLTALVDETIQIFSGRGAAVSDIWLDFSGAATGILLTTLVCFLLRKGKLKAAPPP